MTRYLTGTSVARSGVFPDPDLAVIDGQQYAARSFSAINDTSSKAISNAVNPTTGVTYCQMGSVLQRVCSAYSSLNAQFCDAGGCTNGLAYTSQSCVSGGWSQVAIRVVGCSRRQTERLARVGSSLPTATSEPSALGTTIGWRQSWFGTTPRW